MLAKSAQQLIRGVASLERVGVGLTGADAHHVIDVQHENLAVADLAGLRGRRDGFDHFVGAVARDRDFDLELGQEVHRVFGAAINLGVAALAAITFDLGHGEAGNADLPKRVAHVVELERLDDRDDEFHGCLTGIGGARGTPTLSSKIARLQQAAVFLLPITSAYQDLARSRSNPSWATESTNVPSRVKIRPREKPREPDRFGLSWA